jgi:cyanophycinase
VNGRTRDRIALLGSGEFEPWTAPIDRALLAGIGHWGGGRVLVLPTASAHEGDDAFGRWADDGVAHYRRLGIPVEVGDLRDRADASRLAVLDALERAAMVFFSGGNPARLVETLAGTPFWSRLVERLDDGLAYAGCSAGVASLGAIAPDSDRDPDDPAIWQPGLGLFPGVVFGPHWDALDTYADGLTARFVASVPPGATLIGIDERTAMVGDGTDWRVEGHGAVHVMRDGSWRHADAGSTLHVEIRRSRAWGPATGIAAARDDAVPRSPD